MRKICRGQDSNDLDAIIDNIILLVLSAVFRNVSRRGKTEVPRNKGSEPGIQLFSVIYAILIDTRLDEFARGGGGRKKQGGGGGMPPPPQMCPWSLPSDSYRMHVLTDM